MASSLMHKDFDAVINNEDIRNLPDCTDELRIVLVGKTGNGKSATGNSIVGRNVFTEDVSASSVTKNCEIATTNRLDTRIRVIDTPGLFDTNISLQKLQREISRCILMSAPGPHVFLLILRVGRFTQEERDAVKQLQEMFGEEARKHTIIVFTGKDTLDRSKKSIQEFISTGDSYLNALTKQCPFLAVNNVERDEKQITDLFELIKSLTGSAGLTSNYYTNLDFKNAQQALVKQRQKQKEEEEKKIEDRLKNIKTQNSNLATNISTERENINRLKRDLEKNNEDKNKQLEQNQSQASYLKQEMTNQLSRQKQDVAALQNKNKADIQNLQAHLNKQRAETSGHQNKIKSDMEDIKHQHAQGIRSINERNEQRLENFKESMKETYPGKVLLGGISANGSPIFSVSYLSSSRKYYLTRNGESRTDCIPGYSGLNVVQTEKGGLPCLYIRDKQGNNCISMEGPGIKLTIG